MRCTTTLLALLGAVWALHIRHVKTGAYLARVPGLWFHGNRTRYITLAPKMHAINVNLTMFSPDKPHLVRMHDEETPYELTYTRGGACIFWPTSYNDLTEKYATSLVLTPQGYYTLVSDGQCLGPSPEAGKLARLPCDSTADDQFFVLEHAKPPTPTGHYPFMEGPLVTRTVVSNSLAQLHDPSRPWALVPNVLQPFIKREVSTRSSLFNALDMPGKIGEQRQVKQRLMLFAALQ